MSFSCEVNLGDEVDSRNVVFERDNYSSCSFLDLEDIAFGCE